MWWGRGDRRERRVLGQIRAGGDCVMRIDGSGRQVVRQRAEYEVWLVVGVGGRVGGVHMSGVGLGVCVGVRVGVRKGQRGFAAGAAAPPSDTVCGLRVVEGKLRVRGMLGERRKGGGTAHHHVGVTSREAKLGKLGEMGQLRELRVLRVLSVRRA